MLSNIRAETIEEIQALPGGTTTSLTEINAGDIVIYSYRQDLALRAVESVTATKIVMKDGTKFWKKNGREVGENSYYRGYIYAASDTFRHFRGDLETYASSYLRSRMVQRQERERHAARRNAETLAQSLGRGASPEKVSKIAALLAEALQVMEADNDAA